MSYRQVKCWWCGQEIHPADTDHFLWCAPASAQPDRGAAPDERFDKGPWRYQCEKGKHFVESADFTHDVRLYINGDFAHAEDYEAYGEALAGALNAAPHSQPVRGVSDGWKLVPVEPTQAMCDAARARAMDWENSGEPWGAMTWFRIYKSMLAAAPSLAQQSLSTVPEGADGQGGAS